MSRFQVTQGEWYDVMRTQPNFFDGNNVMNINTWQSMPTTPEFNWRNLPVERVSWYGAIVFSNTLSIREGLTPAYEMPDAWPNPASWSTDPAAWGPVPTARDDRWDQVRMVPGSTGYRLPTEAQWEFAARGGHGTPGNFMFSGSDTAGDVAWYRGNSPVTGYLVGRTHPVGTRAPNGLGLYDMSGNVWEWVWDGIGPRPSVPETDPVGASSGTNRGARGASWSSLGGALPRGPVRSQPVQQVELWWLPPCPSIGASEKGWQSVASLG
ncbi:MAG: formylglycine-generating enzyme family protein [Treponema sp.]|nr:formylglycine-generating enzyme family protein [Treponema sp.]